MSAHAAIVKHVTLCIVRHMLYCAWLAHPPHVSVESMSCFKTKFTAKSRHVHMHGAFPNLVCLQPIKSTYVCTQWD